MIRYLGILRYQSAYQLQLIIKRRLALSAARVIEARRHRRFLIFHQASGTASSTNERRHSPRLNVTAASGRHAAADMRARFHKSRQQPFIKRRRPAEIAKTSPASIIINTPTSAVACGIGRPSACRALLHADITPTLLGIISEYQLRRQLITRRIGSDADAARRMMYSATILTPSARHSASIGATLAY